jgi:hypothetical protein
MNKLCSRKMLMKLARDVQDQSRQLYIHVLYGVHRRDVYM